MGVRLIPIADDFEKLRKAHENDWPDDVKRAAARVQLSLDVANGKGFKQSQAMQNGLAEDWADFQAKFSAWRWPRE